MAYRMVYFRIQCAHENRWGYPDEQELPLFKEESRRLFQEAGWTIQKGTNNGCSDSAFKGQMDLYLHPQSFSGVLLEEEISEVQALLARANTFQCYHVDRYEEYLDLSDEDYRSLLESKREEIITAILERCRTKHSNLYWMGSVVLRTASEFSVHRLCDKDGTHDKANLYVSELVKQLISEGYLITANTRNGIGIRTATQKELKRAGKISLPNGRSRDAQQEQLMLKEI